MKLVNFSDLIGKTFISVDFNQAYGDAITFNCSDGTSYYMCHRQDFCESVYVEDIDGDLQRLLNSPIIIADESFPDLDAKDKWDESYLWTFYKLATNLDSVTIHWYGTSNGYYSVSVNLYLEDD